MVQDANGQAVAYVSFRRGRSRHCSRGRLRRQRAKHVSLFSTWLGTPLHRPAMHRTQPVQQPVGISGETLVHNKPAVGGAGGALLLVEEKAGAPGTSTPHVAGGVAWARASRRRSFVSRIRDRDRAGPTATRSRFWVAGGVFI